jgi:hypothetical protein
MDPNKEMYLFFAFILSYMFFNLYFSDGRNTDLIYDGNIFLYASIVSFLLYTYQESFRLCGITLILIIYYILKKKV